MGPIKTRRNVFLCRWFERTDENFKCSIRVVEVDDGTTFMIAIYDSKESANKAKPRTQEMLAGMAEFMTAPP